MHHINFTPLQIDRSVVRPGGATMPWGRDSITLLHCKDQPVTKRLCRDALGAIIKKSYGNAFTYDAIKVDVANLQDLSRLLAEVEAAPHFHAIRGRIKGGEEVVCDVLRRKSGDAAVFEEDPAGHHWIMLDLDSIATPMLLAPPDDIEVVVGFLVRLLPAEFHDASFHWQWSCGAGLDGWKTLQIHLWFWSERRHTDQELRRWGRWVNGRVGDTLIDCSVFQAVQPHYTAGPILDGVEDPCAGFRSGFHQGDRRCVRVEMPPTGWLPERERAMRATSLNVVGDGGRGNGERWIDWLAEVGDDRMGFHEPITKAVASYVVTAKDPDWEYLKDCIRVVAGAARNDKGRDLDADYLTDAVLDGSIAGAVSKFRRGGPQ
jgi:hypothetical protein